MVFDQNKANNDNFAHTILVFLDENYDIGNEIEGILFNRKPHQSPKISSKRIVRLCVYGFIRLSSSLTNISTRPFDINRIC